MTGRLIVSAVSFPYGAAITASYTEEAAIVFDSARAIDGPVLELDGSDSVYTEEAIVYTLAAAGGLSDDSVKTSSFFAIARSVEENPTFEKAMEVISYLDAYLAYRTFLVGHDLTAADLMLWGSMKSSAKVVGLLKNRQPPHLLRWYAHIESLESTKVALAALAEAKADIARSGSKTASSFAIGLENAIMGEVVTRFPPEPSGYLHIGHAKAAMLNQYFAKMYQGKLIIRFDDTNPSKERSEFEESILEDLSLLNVHGDRVTHTSDYFDHLHSLASKMIESGKAYADDIDSITVCDIPCSCSPKRHGNMTEMAYQRWHGIPSKRRDASIQENLDRFAEMRLGSEEGRRWCLRAKISIDNPNKALRDPVIYRCNMLLHHRTGDKWKVYPTYDFACPIVDSIEGVTHALRTNEYRDRNPQYYWMIDALGLRKVQIWDFSRLNFIYTLLSKRKLHWFVDNGLVRGWDDPRFPTVRGIRRRGMTVEALSQFMLSQGPSQAIVSLEWDSIWSLNKKIIDPIAPRFWAVVNEGKVPVTINGGPINAEVKQVPKHKKNPNIGQKETVYTSSIFIEQEDALFFDDQEEITLMDWGNAIVRSKATDSSGSVISIVMDLNLAGDFRKTKKKVTWLAQPPAAPLVNVTLLDYDYLITKKKLEEDDDVKDFVTPVTEFREDAVADGNVRDLKKGDILQFERKGYFIYDGEVQGKMEFIRIPDGKAAGLASKAGMVISPAA